MSIGFVENPDSTRGCSWARLFSKSMAPSRSRAWASVSHSSPKLLRFLLRTDLRPRLGSAQRMCKERAAGGLTPSLPSSLPSQRTLISSLKTSFLNNEWFLKNCIEITAIISGINLFLWNIDLSTRQSNRLFGNLSRHLRNCLKNISSLALN